MDIQNNLILVCKNECKETLKNNKNIYDNYLKCIEKCIRN